MSKFAVVATYEIAPEQIDIFLPLLFAHRDRCLENEPGTLRFDVSNPRTISCCTKCIRTKRRSKRIATVLPWSDFARKLRT